MKVAGFDIGDVAGPQRDRQIVDIVLGGGAINWGWVQIPLADGRGYFEVTADYLAIGTGADWCRVPIGGPAAQIIADKLDGVLPTAFMVDLIWKSGATKLTPQPFNDLTGMTTTKRFVEHNALVERQRQGRTGLVVGHKKDLIVSNRLQLFPTAVCIYGWHQANGAPIQPVSTFHKEWWYSDYSHGVRLVKKSLVLDGKVVDMEAVWRDPKLAQLLTGGQAYATRTKQDDAVLRVTRYNTSLLSGGEPASSRPVATPEHMSPDDLGLRALNWCRRELADGVREEPPGSNAGPRIAEYFQPARRRATGQLLGINQGDWCAVAQSAALAAVGAENEPVPHGYRAAVWELEDDARQSKAWVPASEIRSGKYRLRPGDLVLWTRGQPGSRLGHVSRVETTTDPKGDMVTIGANENNGWTRRTRNISEAEFRGAIKYRDFLRVDFSGKGPKESASIVQRPPETLVQSATPEMILTVEGWLRFEEDYLPRVVTGENGRAHSEALKAQAIASRTYVLRAMRDDPKLGRTVPIVNSEKFQVFAKKALMTCIAAVEATRGMVAMWQGRLIVANYVAGALWEGGKPGRDPTKTEKWVTYNEGLTGKSVKPTKLSSVQRSDNRGCMSQNGADWLAREGRSFADILRFFYGADLEITGLAPSIEPTKGSPMHNTLTWNAPQRIVPKRSGIEVLAMSTRRASLGVAQAPLTVGIGAPDQVQAAILELRPEMAATNTRVQTYFGETDSLRKQWEEYQKSFKFFDFRNFLDTPLREANALLRAHQYKDGLKDWNYAIDVRMNQKHTVVEGKASGIGYGVLAAMAAAAVVGIGAVIAVGSK
jgi:hypothetical protein